MVIETLEDYLVGDYHQDVDDISQLEETLERTANIFILAQHQKGAWPYLYRQSEGNTADDRVSHGTQAMIAVALARIGSRGRLASGRPARLKLAAKDDIRASLKLGISRLVGDLSGKLKSRSFGVNDPVTLSHFADLLDAMAKVDDPSFSEIDHKINEAIQELWAVATFDPRSAVVEKEDEKALLRALPSVRPLYDGEDPASDPGRKPDRLMNAFVPLRIARSVIALSKLQNKERPENFDSHYRRFFESSLHEQLSYSDIPDSRFDPAELIFCLEGLILIAPNAVDDRLFDRVLDVLEAKQDESAHWRPSRPIYATHQGMTMLPVSVEGAVSLMRSIAIKDCGKDFQPLSVRTIPMARRFWKWLQARAVRFDATFSNVAVGEQAVREAAGIKSKFKGESRQVAGWHSEHVNDPELVHLWDTSQVAEFMLAYRELLHRAIAGRTLQLSGLKINRPARERLGDAVQKWEEIVSAFEPRIGADDEKQVYRKIGTSFLQPWAADEEEKASSMLLYGPPGTGKSTVGENLADALGMRMITVTVSDFLGRGGAYVEARAKAIFQTLEAQFDTIILFDEIDTFLLDRDSARYDKQDTLFQFLTPGMLTKINDLHKLGRSIFIIATNYANRIDPAIQRKGRIDQHYLLALPDRERRKAILKTEMGLKDDAALPEELLRQTVFYGYSDIKAAVHDAGGKSATTDDVASEVAKPERSPSTVGSYLKRVGKESDDTFDWTDFPDDEFAGLVELWEEVDGKDTLQAMVKKYESHTPITKCESFLVDLRRRMEQPGD
ncbi:ATP-binding protein [Novosphingobium taihuense]|uniref:MoxR-like ATPase n=1 Tax=Novosphingobium taihuense TaxID=260085 RepID=A0A7W7EW71_9SPHN|nr:ATP-binding protein [Novosphingobium taihuense]MBB4615784.1 MoxR-like ATPase [Novosphingobium taihuense]TWH79701.1 ATPase family protein associated with various cellular activities (AAA) [Novosphingobium taihuense]